MASRGSSANAKGKDFERKISKEIASALKEEVNRTPSQERFKVRNQGDVNARDYNSILSRFHLELKCHDTLAIPNWWKKTKDDSLNRTPVLVAHLKQSDDLVIMKLPDWLRILHELKGYIEQEKNPD